MSNVFNINTEEAVLANLLQNEDLIERVKIETKMFQDQSVAIVFDYIMESGKVDLNDLYQKSRGQDLFMTTDKLGSLYNSDEVSKGLFMQEQRDLLENYKKREILNLTKEYQKSNMSNSDSQYMQEKIQEVNDLSIKDDKKLKNQLLTFMDNFLSDDPKTFVKTGLNNIDNQILGFEPSQLIILGARPGAGKTALALNMMYNIARNGYPVTFFSLETTDQKILERLISSTSNVPTLKIVTKNDIDDKEANRVMKSIDTLDKLDETGFNIVDQAYVTQNDVRQATMQQHDKPHVVFIDYLQLLNPEKTQGDRRLDVEKISRDLKIIAKE
ncbi:MAG: DnaB helicase C-terminal domain-containing protein, partial [Tetragenococcus halophilus]|nr:DnaB helicase C-terminal domain-containing protein [Tetragenococcus halophilus]